MPADSANAVISILQTNAQVAEQQDSRGLINRSVLWFDVSRGRIDIKIQMFIVLSEEQEAIHHFVIGL